MTTTVHLPFTKPLYILHCPHCAVIVHVSDDTIEQAEATAEVMFARHQQEMHPREIQAVM